ncbi:MAG: acyl-CoA dehydrogenase [Ignavibacteria bacterium RIFOXYC2_FULL_35_21]|nr:MAG: acyl-CoA dehydrogenase [Ignavibacteria bacterium RIFOXYA2_FULL_35_10]OGV21249.1 MAG: acyl-CoA dehydrogenase [Ignavibacteria bacterium RIFOXYC2_FULL_35_21]
MFSIDYDEIQLQIKDAAKKFAEEEILPGTIERDVKAEFPREILTKLGELGFLGMMVSPQWGGSGLDTVSYTLAIEEIAKVEAAVTIVLSVQNSLVNWLLDNYGTDEQKEKYLRPLAEGKKIGAFCLSEPEAGSDATKQHTLAQKQGSHWILNGMKNWISTGINADLFIVFAQTNMELRHKGISCFIIEKGTQGFEPGIPENKMGMRSSDTCSIGLTNVKVPESQMIGEPGMGFKIAMKSLNGGRIGIAAQAVGIAQGAFERSMKYARQRFAFGKPIFEHQMIQQKLAHMATKIDAARLLTHKAAYLKDTNQDIVLASAEAKLFASAIANEVTRDAVQIHGGYGYVREYHVERMMRDAKVTEIYEGTSEVQQIVILRELMKLY